MRKVIKKLKSDTGATLMMALLFFVVCAVTGSMILVSATASSGRLENMKRRDQNYFAVMSAIKMCEQQMKEMDIAFSDKLVVTEVEKEEDDEDVDDIDEDESVPGDSRVYTIEKQQFGDEAQYPICAWIKDEMVSNYHEKVKAADEKRDAFDLKWFKGLVKDVGSDSEDIKILKKHQSISFASILKSDKQDESNMSQSLEDLNVEIDVELNSQGVMTYTVYNSDTINGKPNKDIYIMTLTVDIDVPCESNVEVEVDEEKDEDGHVIKTTTTTTYTNDYTFNFKVRDIKKG